MQDAYESDYYDLNDLWTKDQVGIDAKNLREELYDRIGDIKDSVKSDLDLDPDQIAEIKRLNVELKELGAAFTPDDIPKKGKALAIAERIQEYNEAYNELHKYETNHDIFAYKKNKVIDEIRERYIEQGIDIPAVETPEYFEWLTNNEEVVNTIKFFNESRRLTLTRDLMYYAALKNNYKLEAYMNSIEIYNASSEEFVELVNEHLKKNNLSLKTIKEAIQKTSKTAKYREDINKLIKPYKVAGEVDVTLIPEKIIVAVKKLEQKIQLAYLSSRKAFKQLSTTEKEAISRAKDVKAMYQRDIDNFVAYVETNAYWKKYYEEKIRAESENSSLQHTKWYKRNHYSMTLKGKKIMKPISIWIKREYAKAGMNKVKTSQYKQATQEIYKELKKTNPKESQAFYDEAFKESAWYNAHHEDTGALKESSRYFEEVEADNIYTEKRPNAKYSRPVVKGKYVRKDKEGENIIRDKFGDLLPKPGKWVNKKYTALQNNPIWFDFYNKLKTHYDKSQSVIAERHHMGLVLPFTQKQSMETLSDSDKGIIDKAKTAIKLGKEKFLFSSAFDIEDEGAKTLYNQSMDHKRVPMAYVKDHYVEQDQVSLDIVSSLMQFSRAAHKWQAVNNVMSESRMLLSLIKYRESEEGLGVLKRDSNDKKIFDAVAKSMGKDRFVITGNQSYMGALTQTFMEMQLLGVLNKPHEKNIPWFKGQRVNVRIDKLADGAMLLASMTQIGGLNMTGVMKGLANSIMAEINLHIEKAANKFFDKKDWKDAGDHFARFKAMKDAFKDHGNVVSTTLSGQLKDIYDPMQGNFLDEYGKKVSGSRIGKLFSTSTWFFNNYIGEFTVAMKTMYAVMGGRKIVKGTVYTREEYIDMKEEEAIAAGKKFGFDEKLLVEQEFKAIKAKLRDAYEIGKDGQVKIKDTIDGYKVDWQIGSKKDEAMKRQIHGISRDLQGNYASFDQTPVQRDWRGKLMIMYKKYLVPALRRRFGKLRRNESTGTPTYGYYRHFFMDLLLNDTKALWKEYLNNILIPAITFGAAGGKFDSKLNDLEKQNIRRAVREMTTLLMLIALKHLLAPKDGEDKDEITNIRWLGLYLVTRASKELGAVSPNPYALVVDNWKILRSPSAISSLVDRSIRVIGQIATDPFGVYKKGAGIAEKGDYKTIIGLRKIIGQFTLPGWENATIRGAWENLERPI